MDSKFNFRAHITYTAEKCIKLIYNISKSAKITWGLDTKSSRRYMKVPFNLYCCTEHQSGQTQ